ncbi:MAG: hypothetical protein KGL46_06035 [Hyphomicrobiales bacterium]|nr:hypothetical protein [Hyphomicrobiales bacterium]
MSQSAAQKTVVAEGRFAREQAAALAALERMQKAALAAQKDANARDAAPPNEPVAEARAETKKSSASYTPYWAAGASVALMIGAGVLGVQHRESIQPANVAAVEQTVPWHKDVAAAEARSREEFAALKREVAQLRGALAVAEQHARTRDKVAANDPTAQSVARMEREAKANVDRLSTRIDRLERLMADPVVTSALEKAEKARHPADARIGKPAIPVGGFVVRSVANGRATIQTHQGLIEVGPGDTIPGAGRVRSVAKINGRWVVETQAGAIDDREY